MQYVVFDFSEIPRGGNCQTASFCAPAAPAKYV